MGTKYLVTNNGLLVPRNNASDPTGVTGGLYYNTTETKLKLYDGSDWIEAGAEPPGIIPVGGIMWQHNDIGNTVSGTNTSSSSSKLIDTGVNFTSSGVTVGHCVIVLASDLSGSGSAANGSTATVRSMTFSPSMYVTQVRQSAAALSYEPATSHNFQFTYSDASVQTVSVGAASGGTKFATNPKPHLRVTNILFTVFAAPFDGIVGSNAGVSIFADSTEVTNVDSSTQLSLAKHIFQGTGWTYRISMVTSPGTSFQLCNGDTISDMDSPMNGQSTRNCAGHFIRGNSTSGSTGTFQSGTGTTHNFYDAVPYVRIK